jgi:hypothetical protein
MSEVGNEKGKIQFTLEEPEFNPNTYIGRFREFQKTCNPFLSFYPNSKINEMRKVIRDQETRELQ